jgi:hypothetical protein
LAWAVPTFFSFSFQKDLVNPQLLKYNEPMELHAKSELLCTCQGVSPGHQRRYPICVHIQR